MAARAAAVARAAGHEVAAVAREVGREVAAVARAVGRVMGAARVEAPKAAVDAEGGAESARGGVKLRWPRLLAVANVNRL